jgi:hypothetical protein
MLAEAAVRAALAQLPVMVADWGGEDRVCVGMALPVSG